MEAMVKRWFFLFFAAWMTACGSSGGTTGGGADAAADAADGSGGCPSQEPRDGDPCSGSASCQYGHAVCCGMSYSQFTCVCQQGSYSCAMTVECNFVCQDGSPGDAGGG
jgi:hypothetical protein